MASRPPEPESADRDPAKARFYIIALHRVLGAVLAMLGLLVIEDRIDWPEKLGYGLLVIGLIDVFVAPILLARPLAHAAPVKRFWKEVTVEPAEGGYRVALDGRALKTQGGAPQVVPARALAELLAAEWSAQGEEIDPAGFPHRDMADYAIDIVAPDPSAAVAKVLRYAETDTLCYRADPDEPLHKRQWEVWEPIVSAFEEREGVRVERVSGIVHKPQPTETLAKLEARLATLDPFTLAALEVATSLSASLCVGLSALDPEAHPQALWAAAELEETWQVDLWGSDAEAEARRERRRDDFLRAVRFARAA